MNVRGNREGMFPDLDLNLQIYGRLGPISTSVRKSHGSDLTEHTSVQVSSNSKGKFGADVSGVKKNPPKMYVESNTTLRN